MSGCNTPKLSYGQGRVRHVKVFDVFYDKGNTLKDMLTAYFTAITQSPYFDWLTEYNTTNYKISRGSYLGLYEDSNSATTAKTLTDTQVQTLPVGTHRRRKMSRRRRHDLHDLLPVANLDFAAGLGLVRGERLLRLPLVVHAQGKKVPARRHARPDHGRLRDWLRSRHRLPTPPTWRRTSSSRR